MLDSPASNFKAKRPVTALVIYGCIFVEAFGWPRTPRDRARPRALYRARVREGDERPTAAATPSAPHELTEDRRCPLATGSILGSDANLLASIHMVFLKRRERLATPGSASRNAEPRLQSLEVTPVGLLDGLSGRQSVPSRWRSENLCCVRD